MKLSSDPDSGNSLAKLSVPNSLAVPSNDLAIVSSGPIALRSATLPNYPSSDIEAIVAEALTGQGHLTDYAKRIARYGGMEAARGIVTLLSAVAKNGGIQNPNERYIKYTPYVQVWTLCNQLLNIAGSIGRTDAVIPALQLSKIEASKVKSFVNILAQARIHENSDLAIGARSAKFDRLTMKPLVGKIIEFYLDKVWAQNGEGATIKRLFYLMDLPWALRSKLPWAGVDSRKNNLMEPEVFRKFCEEYGL